jgi:hypothetical protein
MFSRDARRVSHCATGTGYASGAAMSPCLRRNAVMKKSVNASRRAMLMCALVASMLVSGVAIADGCLQGTWHYFDANGRLVGGQTVGCGELDGSWGAVTANKTFSQGCASAD